MNSLLSLSETLEKTYKELTASSSHRSKKAQTYKGALRSENPTEDKNKRNSMDYPGVEGAETHTKKSRNQAGRLTYVDLRHEKRHSSKQTWKERSKRNSQTKSTILDGKLANLNDDKIQINVLEGSTSRTEAVEDKEEGWETTSDREKSPEKRK